MALSLLVIFLLSDFAQSLGRIIPRGVCVSAVCTVTVMSYVVNMSSDVM